MLNVIFARMESQAVSIALIPLQTLAGIFIVTEHDIQRDKVTARYATTLPIYPGLQ